MCLQNKTLLQKWREIDPEVIDELVEVLKPFKEITRVMSTESSSSISLIRPLHQQIMKNLRKPTTTESTHRSSLHDMKETIRNDMEKRSVHVLLVV